MIVEIARADQQRGNLAASLSPDGTATLLGAVGDGLLLHALLEPSLDVAAAVGAVRALIRGST